MDIHTEEDEKYAGPKVPKGRLSALNPPRLKYYIVINMECPLRFHQVERLVPVPDEDKVIRI